MSKYDFLMDEDPASISGKIMNRIRRGADVLEFGCAEGRMTRYMREKLDCRVCIVELDPAAFAVAEEYAADGWCGDAETLGWAEHFRGRQFDFILFADVLEHLRNPEAVLRAVKPFLREGGEVVVSIPNIAHNDIMTKLFFNRFDYTAVGLLDDTHVHFWGIENLDAFAQHAGYALCVLDGVVLPSLCTEQGKGLSEEEIPFALKEALSLRPYNDIYQVFMVLQTAEWAQAHQVAVENRLDSLQNSTRPATLFWKMGEAYSADSAQTVFPQIRRGGVSRFRIDSIPENCEAVRFDPVENTGCVIRKFCARADGNDCMFTALNGFSSNGMILFTNQDPQLEISFPAGTKELEISAQISVLDERTRHWLESELRANVAQLAERDNLLAQQQSQLAERNTVIAQQQSQMTQQSNVIAQQSGVIAQQQSQLAERDGVIAQQQTQLAERDGVIAQQQLQLAERDGVIAQQQTQLAERDNLLAQQQSQLAVLQWQYDDLTHAFFWRVTGPLRRALDTLKRNQWVALFDKGLHSLKTFGVKATWAKVKAYRQKEAAVAYAAAVEAEAQFDASSELSMQAFIERCKAGGGEVFGETALLGASPAERVLLVSHELNLTGAPIALQYFAESLQRQGKLPVVIAPHDDALRPLLTGEGIPVLTHPALYQSDFVADCASLFSMIIINTIVGAPIAARLSGSDVPVLWWIHEAHVSYHPGALAEMPESLGANIRVYCAGSHAEKVLRHYRPAYSSQTLLYCLPDIAAHMPQREALLPDVADKTVFALVGMLEERKGQDVLAQAVRLLSDAEREKSLFVFIGRECHPSMRSAIAQLCKDYPDSARYIPGLSRDDILRFYKQMDCAICASRDDPMPITVTEALALSKVVICSENTGSAALLQEMDSGYVYHNNDPAELSAMISRVLSDTDDSMQIARAARRTYEKYFTLEAFDWKTTELCSRIIEAQHPPLSEKVSVVIPTYNAGAEFAPLLELLVAQRGVGKPELVIVDSGSTDGTPDVARSFGAKVIEIPQERFSHSYARNLGMENASGKYTLVMTQDAVPGDHYWLWKLAQPIINDGVAAVSCRQIPKPGCDLLGRLSLYIHAEYMGILDRDRLLSLPATHDFDSLRKNGQLDDVACLYDREIFLKFRYRGNYAEDLDIGLRLIRAGYRLALLSSAPVIHSHTRPAYYHLKRGVVDVSVLKTILPDYPVHTEKSAACMDQIITAYAAEKLFADDLLLTCAPSEKEALHRWVDAEFDRIRTQIRNLSPEEMRRRIEATTAYTDQKYQQVVLEFLDKRGDAFRADVSGTYDQAYFITTHVLPFLARESGTIGAESKRELADAMEKHAAQLAGNLLAGYVVHHHGEDPYMDELCRELSKGV